MLFTNTNIYVISWNMSSELWVTKVFNIVHMVVQFIVLKLFYLVKRANLQL